MSHEHHSRQTRAHRGSKPRRLAQLPDNSHNSPGSPKVELARYRTDAPEADPYTMNGDGAQPRRLKHNPRLRAVVRLASPCAASK